MHKKMIATMVVGAVLTGCGTPWPIEPKYVRKALATGAVPEDLSDIDSAKKIAYNWEKALGDASRDRRKQEIALSELVFYGTLLLTGGQAWLAKEAASTDALRARNLGVAGAAGGSLLNGHYQPRDQRLAFAKAEERMACLNEALSPVPSINDWASFRTEGKDVLSAVNSKMGSGTTLDSLYLAVPRQALAYIEGYVTPQLKAQLLEISLGSPSREEVVAAVKQYNGDKAAGAQAVAEAASAAASDVPESSSLAEAKQSLFAAKGKAEDETAARKKLDQEEAAHKEQVRQAELKVLRRAAAVDAITGFTGAIALCKAK